jgi:AraC-like DNA-binding protein
MIARCERRHGRRMSQHFRALVLTPNREPKLNDKIAPRPLASFPILRSRDPEEFRNAVSRSYDASSFDFLHRAKELEFRVNHWQSKNIGLTYFSGAPFQLEFPTANYFRQAFIRGRADIKFGCVERRATNEETCVVPPDAIASTSYGPGFEHFGLRIKADAVLSKLAALIGATPSQKLVFDQTTRANGSAIGNLQRLLMFFAGELDSTEAAMPSLAIAELEQALIVSFICSNQHNYSAFLEGRAPSAAPWQVRRAEEYIEAHWDQPITIETLARVTASSARSIFYHFKHSRGRSPMTFVKDVRLRHAKEMLELTDPMPSVTETAIACGFGNLGHFANDYFKRFGERPSETVKRHKRDVVSTH